ncbi:hypothetical protein B0H14DRAFT_2621609 [Mycena olivaceomarginata]|nr:hypothetical protein B0H14DRAFT_2621609 [Mycena olivaceomarginata]
MEMGQDNSSSGIWEPVKYGWTKYQRVVQMGTYLEGVGRGKGYIAGAVARWRTWMRTRGRGEEGNCARLKTGRWWGHAHARPGGGGWWQIPLMRAAWLPFVTPVLATAYMAFLGGVGLSRDALARLWCRPIAIFPIQRMPVRNGVCCGVDERGEGREAPRRRARWPAQCGAVDGETYIETGGNVGGQGSVSLLRIRLRGAWGSFGVECAAAVHGAMCLRATERGGWRCWSVWQWHGQRCHSVRGRKRALSWTVGMPEWSDVWVTSDVPGEKSMGGWNGRVARGWARALGVVVEAVEVRLRASLQLPQRGNISSPVGMRVGRRGSGSGRITRMGQYHLGEARCDVVLGAKLRTRQSFCGENMSGESFQEEWVALDRRRAPPHARRQTRRVDAAETAGHDGNPRTIPETIPAVTCCEKNLRVNRTPGAALLLGSGIYTGWRFGSLISVRLKTTGGARFDPLGLRRIMFNFEQVQHAVVNPAWDKKAGKF